MGGLAQSVECVVSNDEAPGSKPGFSTLFVKNSQQYGILAEWLRRAPAKCVGSARVSSNLTDIVHFGFSKPKSISARVPKSSSSGNRTPGVCVTGRNVTNYTNEEEKGTTGIEPVTAGSAIPCSTAELSTHLRLGVKGPGWSGIEPGRTT